LNGDAPRFRLRMIESLTDIVDRPERYPAFNRVRDSLSKIDETKNVPQPSELFKPVVAIVFHEYISDDSDQFSTVCDALRIG
jgi:hypothetical protein